MLGPSVYGSAGFRDRGRYRARIRVVVGARVSKAYWVKVRVIMRSHAGLIIRH